MRSRHSAFGTRRSALGKWSAATVVACALAGAAACTKGQVSGGDSPVYVVVDGVSAAAGAQPTQFGGTLASDVLTYVKKNINNAQVCVPTVFEDPGRVTVHLQMKDPGSAAVPTIPTQANTVTLTRYHVHYIRADGLGTPGVDVPYDFDGGMQQSIVGGNVAIGQLIIVRIQAKEEAPLQALIGGGGARAISTIAQITFYGTDAAGRDITATGNIGVDFADWGDPDC
jgi:hypothetical protein